MNIQLEELYLAYRKAKKEAFGDTNCAHGVKFAEFEQNLESNFGSLTPAAESGTAYLAYGHQLRRDSHLHS